MIKWHRRLFSAWADIGGVLTITIKKESRGGYGLFVQRDGKTWHLGPKEPYPKLGTGMRNAQKDCARILRAMADLVEKGTERENATPEA